MPSSLKIKGMSFFDGFEKIKFKLSLSGMAVPHSGAMDQSHKQPESVGKKRATAELAAYTFLIL